jgi:hypothetical protein
MPYNGNAEIDLDKNWTRKLRDDWRRKVDIKQLLIKLRKQEETLAEIESRRRALKLSRDAIKSEIHSNLNGPSVVEIDEKVWLLTPYNDGQLGMVEVERA